MTGRLPMRHGLHAPADVRRARRAAGRGHDRAAARRRRVRDPGRRQVAHGRERASRSRRTSASTTSTASSRVSDMYTEWRDPYFFPEVVYCEERTKWIENQPFNKCFVHAEKGGEHRGGRGGHDPGALAARRQVVRRTRSEFIERMARRRASPWFLYHCTRGAHFDNYPHPDFLGKSPAKHPYKDAIDRARRHRRPAGRRRSRRPGSSTTRSCSSPPTTARRWRPGPTAAYSPFRSSKGSHVGGRPARARASSPGAG